MKKALILVLALGATYGVWRWRSAGEAHATDSKLAFNRIWIDHMPRNDKDVINFFVLIDSEAMGVFQSTTAWKGNYELFRYEANGDEVRMVFPQNNEKSKAKVNARKCSEKSFDYCLDIDGASRGVKKYYSMEGWEIDQRQALENKIEALEQAAPHEAD